jgi:hypothetical protein
VTKSHEDDYHSDDEYEQTLHEWMNDDSYIESDTIIPYEKHVKGTRYQFE